MIILYILLIITALLIIFTLTSKVKFFLEYKKYPCEKLYVDFKFSVGFINLTKLLKRKIKSVNNKAPQKNQEESQQSKLKGYIKKITDATKTFNIVKKVYSKNRWNIQKSLVVENADFHLKFGLFDAAQTGIMTSAVWTFLYTSLALADSVGTVKKHFFEVTPVFTEPGFISKGKIKLSIRVINALSLFVRLYLTYKKVAKDNK